MNLDGTVQDVDELFAMVALELAELSCADERQCRKHALLTQLRAQLVIVVARCAGASRIGETADAAAGAAHRAVRSRRIFRWRKQPDYRQLHALLELHQSI